jgi:hypothetical protein
MCRDTEYFEELCTRVEHRELLSDLLIDQGVAALANTDEFFLFTAPIRTAALALSRDTSAATAAAVHPHPRLVGLGRGGARHGAYPPGGALPGESAVALMAPLAYLHNSPQAIFATGRALHCRYANVVVCESSSVH